MTTQQNNVLKTSLMNQDILRSILADVIYALILTYYNNIAYTLSTRIPVKIF